MIPPPLESSAVGTPFGTASGLRRRVGVPTAETVGVATLLLHQLGVRRPTASARVQEVVG